MDHAAEWITAPPAPSLRPLIDRYIGYRLTGFGAGVHRGLPSRHMTFIASIGPSIDLITPSDPQQSPGSYACVVGGLHARSALISHTGHQEGVAINLTPLGCRVCSACLPASLWNISVECVDVAGAAGSELWERLQGDAPWTERFAVCDEVLSRVVDHELAVAPGLRHTWEELVGSRGMASIEMVAADVGWSRQHLAKRFTAEFGLGPKLAARVMRFERARSMLEATPSFVTIAQVAATCGYYDQAHLNRDFAELAGCSPTEWLAEELPSFQDGARVSV